MIKIKKHDKANNEKDISKTFSKEQILKSNKFKVYADIVNATLDDNMQYTIKDVEKIIYEFLNRRV